ncbi:MAG: hypothetical protein P8X81_06740 [Woeseiaceae bacterium]|jgi:DUF4097 and DUF4098 domain-containing protein YvlB
MRSFIIIAMFTASLAHAAWNGYTEDRNLELDADGLTGFEIDAGAGSLVVTGVEDLQKILVTATIKVPDKDDDDALEMIEKNMRLSLDNVRGEARLIADFQSFGWSWGDSPTIDLDVQVPYGLALAVDDGSGSIRIDDVRSAVIVDDGSGSLRIQGATSVKIDDGSGSVTVTDVSGNVDIEDGSGSITVERVGGSVTIDDGSGGIDVNDVEHDLTIIDDGSGGLNATNVRGDVNADG